jgi:hypothetical protein
MTVNQISHKDFPTRKWVQGGELVTASGINTGSDMYLPGMGDTKGFDRAAALANERDINLEDPQVRNKYGQNLLKIMKDAPTQDDMIEEFNNFETQMGYIPKAALDYLASKERKQKLSRADTARTAREASPGAAGSSQIPLPEGFMPYYQSYLEQTGYEPPQRKGGALTDAAAKQPPPPQATAPQAAAAPQAATAPQAAATGGDISYGEKQASFLSTAETRYGLPPEITKLIITGQQSKLDPGFPKQLIGEVLTDWSTFNRTGKLSQNRIPYYQNSGTR